MSSIKTLIDAYIKRNANQEITGPVLNGVLTAIADALGTPFIGEDGYWYTYDPEAGQFVQTDTPAQGESGVVAAYAAVGIGPDPSALPSVDVIYDATLRQLDFTFYDIQGPKGDQGTPGITGASVSVDANVGTPSVDASIVNSILTLAFHNLRGAAAGFGTPTISVGANQGTPSASVTASGPDTAKVFAFAFDGLKGETGPQGPQGPQGNPGSSQDYPFTLANNLTTDDSTVALTAAMGVQLEGEVSQLSQVVDEISADVPNYIAGKAINSTGISDAEDGAITDYLPVAPGQQVTIGFGGATVQNGAICFYDENKAFVDWWSMYATERTVTAPANSAYVRTTLYLPGINECYIRIDGEDVWSPTKKGISNVVLYNKDQALTDPQKAQGRTNIGAAGASDLNNLSDSVSELRSPISSTDYISGANTSLGFFVSMPKDRVKITVNLDSSVWPYYEIRRASSNHQNLKYFIAKAGPGQSYIIEKDEDYPDLLIYNSATPSTDKTVTVIFENPDSLEGIVGSLTGGPLRKVALFGDSLTEFGGTNNKGLGQWLQDKMYCQVYNLGIGGSRISQRRTPTATPSTTQEAYAIFDLPNWVKSWVDNDFTIADACNAYLIPQGDNNDRQIETAKAVRPADVDTVVIFAGTNDFVSEASMGSESSPADGTANNTVSGAIKYAVEKLLSGNPALKIFVFSPIVRYLSYPWTDAEWSDNKVLNGIHLYDVETTIKNALKVEHIPVCEWYWTLGWNKANFDQYFNSPDGTHPDDGYEYLAEKMAHFIMSH